MFKWQSLFHVSDAGIEVLFLLLAMFISLLGRVLLSDSISSFAKKLPTTLYMAKTLTNSNKESFVRYVTCPKCKFLYKTEHSRLKLPDKTLVSRKCEFTEYPHYPFPAYCVPCKQVKTSAGKLYPRQIFCYKSLIEFLNKMIRRNDFVSKCELWRNRKRKVGVYSDIYDGKVWEDFLEYDSVPFLSVPYNFALSLNVDWFQPYRHMAYSLGVLYVAILNLP